MNKTELIHSLERAIKYAENYKGRIVLCGRLERLEAVVSPSFRHIFMPQDLEKLEVIRLRLKACKHDLIKLLTLALRLRWLQNLFRDAMERGDEDEKRDLKQLMQAFTEADLGAFHTLLVSTANHATKTVFEVFDEMAGPFNFRSLHERINEFTVPDKLALGSPFGEAFISIAPLVLGAEAACQMIENLGAREVAWTDANGTAEFQILADDNNPIICPERIDLGLPETVLSGRDGGIGAEVYFGSLVGQLICFLNEFAYFLYEVLLERKLIRPKETLSLSDPRLFEVLRESGFSESDLDRVHMAGSGTATIDRTPYDSEHYVLGTPETVEAIKTALAFLTAG